jgi:ParB-like nuclease domain
VSDGSAVTVRVADLVLDDAYQVRRELDRGAIKRYADAMRAGHKFPPIKVAQVNGAPIVVDGWHRTSAARLIGRATLSATVVTADEQELAWIAAEANLTHGVPLKKGEARNLFRAYVRAGRHRKSTRRVKSSREIADELHGMKSHATILGWMKQDFPTIYRAMRRSDEEPRSDGGLPEMSPEDRRCEAVSRAMADIIANARGISSPAKRGEIIAELQMILEDVKQARPWEPVKEVEEDDPF